MDQAIDFFRKLFDTSDFPPRWHCGRWTEFHGWLYIVSDLLVWSAYFTIPLIIMRYISKKQDRRFIRLYFLFAGFILACGATHFLDALTFWVPVYRINALLKAVTGVLSWITVFYLVKFMPVASSLRSVEELEKEIEQRKAAESEVRRLNERLEDIVWQKTKEIMATESRFRSIIENNSEAIALTDEKFAPFYLNQFAEKVTGRSSGARWRDRLHPDDGPKLNALLANVLANPNVSYDATYRTQHNDGHYIWLEGTVTNMLDHPHVKAIVFNFRDVTERKTIEEKLIQSEKTYHSIAANFPNSIITIIDRDDRFVLAEGEGLVKMGTTTESLVGKKQNEGLDSEAYGMVAEYRNRAFAGEIVSETIFYNEAYYLMRYVPLRNEEGYVYEVLTISLDITDIKKAEIEIKALNETLEKKVTARTNQLEAANKELEAFSYSVSHDLRAPLRIINGYADILKTDHAGQLDEEAHRLLSVIMNNVRQMGILIDELLKLSRLSKKEISFRNTNMSAIVHAVISEQTAHGAINTLFKVGQLLPANCDSVLIRYVWNNLISNAVKYSGKKASPLVEINSVQNEDEVIYSVQDNGAGFDMKYKSKLFGVFQRLHNKAEFEGTGVGLALVQRIVLKHGGRAWAIGEENKGATFYFSLPIHTSHERI